MHRTTSAAVESEQTGSVPGILSLDCLSLQQSWDLDISAGLEFGGCCHWKMYHKGPFLANMSFRQNKILQLTIVPVNLSLFNTLSIHLNMAHRVPKTFMWQFQERWSSMYYEDLFLEFYQDHEVLILWPYFSLTLLSMSWSFSAVGHLSAVEDDQCQIKMLGCQSCWCCSDSTVLEIWQAVLCLTILGQ